MFGWFRKKEAQVDRDDELDSTSPAIEQAARVPSPPAGMPTTMPLLSPTEMPTIASPAPPKNPDALLQRFAEEFAAIKSELEALLSEASAGSEALIETQEVGDRRLINAWYTVNARYRDLLGKLGLSWERISRKLANSVSDQIWEAERLKRNLAEAELELLFVSARCQVMARAGERGRQHAQATAPKNRACQFCGGQLPPLHAVSIAVNLPCEFCKAVNSIDPGVAWRNFAGEGALALSELEALPRWTEMNQLRVRLEWYDRDEKVPLQLLENYYEASRTYWTVFETSLAQLVPEKQGSLERTMASRMAIVERTLKEYPAWKTRNIQ